MNFLQILAMVTTILLLLCSFSEVDSLEESLCAGLGFWNINTESMKGYWTTGWDRFYASNKGWTSFFWTVQAAAEQGADPDPMLYLSFVKDEKGHVLNGWLHISISRPQDIPFHYAAIWAVTESNEVYGSFIFDTKRETISCNNVNQLFSQSYAYIPCSAGPVNVESVPNMFAYANLEREPSTSGDSFIQASVKTGRQVDHVFAVLWRYPPQTYCNRPLKIRIIYATTPIHDWHRYASNWDAAIVPGTMWFAKDHGPIVRYSDWIHPKFYGHPSNIDLAETISCANRVSKANWVSNMNSETLPGYWYTNSLWSFLGSRDGEFGHNDVKERSTCKGHEPTFNEIKGYKGRCVERKGSAGKKYYTAKENQGLKCSDAGGPLGKAEFKTKYSDYLTKLKKLLQLNCECKIVTKQEVTHSSLKMLMMPPPLPWPPKVSTSVKLRKSDFNTAVYEKDLDICVVEKVKIPLDEIFDKGGVCVQTPVGKLVYGVRQWHGVTSLCVTMLITPISIFIARYTKGDMVLLDGRVPIKTWYLTHVILVFPAIWMHASGMATMGRQVDVLGRSLTSAAKLHRILGILTFALIPIHVVTGFFRPVNCKARKIFIFLHWFGGTVHHFLELLLCCMSFQIPASPTTASCILCSNFDNFFHSSKVGLMLIAWFVFSMCFNVLLTFRTMRHDRRMGVRERSVFPIIIPVLTQENKQDLIDAEHSQELCFERGSLLIYLLVSCVFFAIAIVSLYQALHERLYYGFGPMSCTHDSNGKFISRNDLSSDAEDICHK